MPVNSLDTLAFTDAAAVLQGSAMLAGATRL